MSEHAVTGQLMDRAALARYLNVSKHAAEAVMRQLPKVHIDDVRKVYVKTADVDRYIDERTRAA